MREAFAHEALVDMPASADPAAIGAAVTVALCGHWAHQPPCPLAPHHTRADRVGQQVRVRMLFAAEPQSEGEVRDRINLALSGGEQTGPDGATSSWRVLSSEPSIVSAQEADHAQRLIRS
jgi:hypothetical protein